MAAYVAKAISVSIRDADDPFPVAKARRQCSPAGERRDPIGVQTPRLAPAFATVAGNEAATGVPQRSKLTVTLALMRKLLIFRYPLRR